MLRYLPLVFANLGRRKLRSVFTLLSIVIAFLLFGLLSAVKNGFEAGIELAGADRLITMHKMSLIQPLPLSYAARIAAAPGVKLVTHSTWFGATYQEDRNVLYATPVDPASYLAMYPEYIVPEGEKQKWLQDRTGVLVGRSFASRFGWKVGDRLPLRSSIYPKADNNYNWEFTIDGIFDNRDASGDTGSILFHYDYFDEARVAGKGYVGWYTVRIDDPDSAPQVAKDIDALFANSPAETKTATEKAFVQGFANQAGNIGAIMTSIGMAVFFTMLLVSANTMAQSVRERTKEIAVMKTLGFRGATLLTLVLAESVLITAIGGTVGLLAAYSVTGKLGAAMSQYISSLVITGRTLTLGIVLMIVLGLIAGALPAARASRLRIADALQR